MIRPMDRVAAESVLYQALLLCIRRPFQFDFPLDPSFLDLMEETLQIPTFAELSPSRNSPVMGVPLALWRLIFNIAQVCILHVLPTVEELDALRTRVSYWEAMVAPLSLECRPDPQSTTYSEHALFLFVLAASLYLSMVTQLIDARRQRLTAGDELYNNSFWPKRDDVAAAAATTPFAGVPPHRGAMQEQLGRALDHLRAPAVLDKWKRCYLGLWPTLIFGHAVRHQDDVALIRSVLEAMQQYTGYGEVPRVLAELEIVWKR
jgi:hypothetical protein